MSVPETGVWVYKDSGTDELKYSIRSAIKNLGLKKVIIIGDKPEWFQESEQAIYLPFAPRRNVNWTRAFVPWMYLEHLLKSKLLVGDFLFFNDDFFILKEIDNWVDYERDPEDYDLFVKQNNRIYHQRDARALRLLRITEEEHHYNLHIPVKLNTFLLKEDLRFWHNSPLKDFGFRTFYGNRHFRDCPKMRDVKYRPNEYFLSTGENWWRQHGEDYKSRFPEESFTEKA